MQEFSSRKKKKELFKSITLGIKKIFEKEKQCSFIYTDKTRHTKRRLYLDKRR